MYGSDTHLIYVHLKLHLQGYSPWRAFDLISFVFIRSSTISQKWTGSVTVLWMRAQKTALAHWRILSLEQFNIVWMLKLARLKNTWYTTKPSWQVKTKTLRILSFRILKVKNKIMTQNDDCAPFLDHWSNKQMTCVTDQVTSFLHRQMFLFQLNHCQTWTDSALQLWLLKPNTTFWLSDITQ